MAKVRDTHLGSIQGSVGPNLFKIRKGKTFVGTKPGKRKKPKTEPETATMTSMGVLSRFASAVCKIERLKNVWNIYHTFDIPLTKQFDDEPFQKIIAYNYSNAANNFLTTRTMLTPEKIAGICVTNSIINSESFVIEFDTTEKLSGELRPQCDFYLMIHLSHRLAKISDKVKDNHSFILLKKSEKSITLQDKGNTLSFPLDNACRTYIDNFGKAMLFFSLVSYEGELPVICQNAEGFLFKGEELHETDIKEYERIKGIKTQKQIKAEKALKNPDFEWVIV